MVPYNFDHDTAQHRMCARGAAAPRVEHQDERDARQHATSPDTWPGRPPRDAPPVSAVTVVLRSGSPPAARAARCRSEPRHLARRGSPRTTSTDEDGRYELTDPAGGIRSPASRGGFLQVRYGQRRPRERGKTSTLGRPGRRGHRSGASEDEHYLGPSHGRRREPIAGVTVLAMIGLHLGPPRTVATSPAMLRTDDVGEYRIASGPGHLCRLGKKRDK